MSEFAFLTTHEKLAQKMLAAKPGIRIYRQASTELLQNSKLLLTDIYSIDRGQYQILNIWRRYFSSTEGCRKNKIALLTTVSYNHPQCISASKIDSEREIFDFVEPLNKIPDYPEILGTDVLVPITRAFISHGENNFFSHLHRLKKEINLLEADMENLKDISSTRYDNIWESFCGTEEVWESWLDFFRLMPQFPELKGWEKLAEGIEKAMDIPDKSDWLFFKYSKKIYDYLDRVVNPIIQLYKMEPYEES
jgi:hypothetical protein